METTSTPRSRATRARILEAARTAFAIHGYDGTTLRNIAMLAQTNVALLIRYFGSKEDLFAMAVDFDLRLPALGELDRHSVGQRMVEHFLVIWEGSSSGRELVALLRAATTHAAARARMQQIFHAQLLGAIASLGFSENDTAIRASLVSSQMLGFALIRYVLDFDQPSCEQEKLVLALSRTIQSYLSDPL